MTAVAETNTILLVIALLIGLAVGWWIFKATRREDKRSIGEQRRSTDLEAPAPTPRQMDQDRPVRPARRDGLVSQGATATADVAGEVLGVKAHAGLPAADGPPDNLQMLKGVGPKFAAMLNENGIIRYDQIAGLSAAEVAILDERMGPFKGRIARDRLIEQAGYLARGDRDGFEAKFGKLGD